jgi:hypothetical protein
MEGNNLMAPAPKLQATGRENINSSENTAQLFNIPIIFPSGKTGSMQIPHPLTEDEWKQLEGFLNIYKPSLVRSVKQKEADGEDTEH